MIIYGLIGLVILGFALFIYNGVKQKKSVYVEPKFTYQPIVKTDLNKQESELLNLINSHRDFLGLPALIPEVLACQVCREAIIEDLKLGEKPSHYQWEQRKLACQDVNGKEILAYNMSDPRSVLAGYLRSHDHRSVVENTESTHIGISYINKINYCIFTRYE